MPPVRRRSPRATPRRGRSSSVASVISVSSANGAASPPPSASKPKRARKSKIARPALPTEKNPRLENYAEQPVRLQLIEREEQEIIVGRVKLPSVNGNDHAFLLKRFDTDAVAASSMYRVAFPFANEAAEASEMRYLESRYETDVANGGRIAVAQPGDVNETPGKRGRERPRKSETPRKDGGNTDTESVAGSSAGEPVKVLPAGSTGVRLQGTWILASDAAEVAQEYGIIRYAEPLIKASAKMAEDGSGPMLVQAPVAAQKTPEKKRGRPAKRARKATEDEEEDQLADEQPAAAADASSGPRVGIRQVNHYDGSGRLTGFTLGPWVEGMSADEDDEEGGVDDSEVEYSGCMPMPRRRRRATREAAPEGIPEEVSEEASAAFAAQDKGTNLVGASASIATGPAFLNQAEIDAQIEEAKALAAGVQRAAVAASAGTSSAVARGQKRAAVNDTPAADMDNALDDSDEDEAASAGRVGRALRRGTRAARRRPVATTAGVLTAAGAIGAAGAAYMTGVDVNTAFQAISQTVQSLGLQNWFF